MKRRFHRLSVVAMTVGLALLVTMPVQAAETYQLGLSLAITGPTSDAGNPYSKGVEDYMRFVNETNVLGDAKVVEDLGPQFGATLTGAEVTWMMQNEYAIHADDVVWRRTRLGLRMNAEQIAALEAWMTSNADAVGDTPATKQA